MNKTFTKRLFFLALFTIFTFISSFAQTITVGKVDPGPYGGGSNIAVPININDASGCIAQNNTFNLYLSDAAGNFAPGKLIGSYNGFYVPFVNGIIPAGTPAGAGYKVTVKSTSPAVTSTISTAFSVNASTAVTAGASSGIISTSYPEVYGSCSGSAGSTYTFNNTSTAGAVTTATFFNEQTQTIEVNNVAIPAAGYTFTAASATNYTVIVKAKVGGTVGTHAYQLLNNVINTNIGATGSLTVCLVNGKGDLTINIDISSSTGIQYNYPGNLYTISWGDGSPADVLTLCQIIAKNGQVTHTFTKSSCGNSVIFQSSNIFCGKIGAAPSNDAKVIVPPTNLFKVPATACAGQPLDIPNLSDPGIDPATCAKNAKALYTWLVDGIIIASNYTLNKDFILPATTLSGSHVITLRLQNSSGGCGAVDVSQNICLQNPPKPIFTVPATACLTSGAITPVNTSVVDATCNANNQFNWTVTPSTFTYAGGTNANSAQPQFKFTAPGVYKIQLGITTVTCGTVLAPAQTIVVDDQPVVTLSPNTTLCGSSQLLTFDPSTGPTKTVISGTLQPLANTYTWVITGGAFTFQGGTNASSKYPQVLFTDFATYTIKITQQNNCGTVTKTQTITFVQAPTVTASSTAGNNPTVCASNPTVSLVGQVKGTYLTKQWIGGSGTFSAGRGSLITNYTPSAAEINAGQVTLTLQATTSLPPPCDIINSPITITITPIANVVSPPGASSCTGQPVNYNIVASDPSSTFNWTASVTSGTATGVAATGSGTVINDIITNTSATTDAIVTYKITPTNSTCTGNTFTLTVTVKPLPKITAVPVNTPICSNQPANILLNTNIPNTSYTWTSTATAGVTGNTNQANPVVTTGIQDVLVNNSTALATVNYIVTPYNGICPGTPIPVSITVQPLPVQSVPGADEEVCFTTTYTLKGNSPSPGTGKWTLVTGPSAVTFSDDTDPHAVVSGLTVGKYQFSWTITATPTCPPNSNVVNITIDKATVGGTTTNAGTSPVCSGSNAGQITLAGQVGTILRWESSVDNGATWQPIINVGTTQDYQNLTQTTQFRAITQSGVCSALASSVTTITVNPITVIADAGTVAPICNQTSAILNGNDPTPFNGVWTQTAGPTVTIVNPSSHQTQVTGLATGNVYTFVWTIKGLPPCGDSQSSVDVSVAADVTAAFTQDKPKGCGPTTVTFTNTSTPSPTGSYLWDFGDGATSTLTNPSPHTFAPSADGKEVTYTITLTPISNCGVKTPVTSQVKVSPAIPVAKLFPSQTTACGAFTLTAQNLSPGNNVQYDFYLTDINGNILQHLPLFTDKSDAVFQPVNPTKPTDYVVYVIATDQCGNQGKSPMITISGSPSTVHSLMQVKGDPQSVCLGNSITLQNVSSGGDRFTYTIYDSNKQVLTTIPGGTDDMNYTPTAVGIYYVSITAGNNGCGDAPESPLRQFSVYPDPQPDFSYKMDNEYNVTFTNNTPADGNTPPESLKYTWDFGDGSGQSTTFEPKHFYDYNRSPFTVTLTATNSASKCLAVVTKTIVVKFLGGIYLPNAFMPTSPNAELNLFKAKGTAIKEWRMQVFNNFGQLVWETTKLDANGSPVEGWDGMFKGSPAQQGVYVWQVSATFINGTEWKGMSYSSSVPKRTGVIHLIR
ncbi:MAG TPA: PKD-like domain-containing protein [Mucilaginibacter sp.]|nr:PKD-like domain-containing protein [Mucilaginibacter sp.]